MASASYQPLLTAQPVPKPLGRSTSPIGFPLAPKKGQDVDEELVWYGRTVIWSRGVEVFRKYTFDHEGEDVSRAAFVCFKTAGSEQQARQYGRTSSEKPCDTFGFFHHSQSALWGAPRSSGQTAPASALQRTLVVFLQTRAHVYFPSGDDVIVHLPFPVDGVWALPQGGAILQRALEKRELRRLGKGSGKGRTSGCVLRGIDQTSMSVLDDLFDLDDESIPSLPRLFTLDNPFDELNTIFEGRVEGGINGKLARLTSALLPLSSTSTILHVSQEPYPFIVVHEQPRGEIIIYRRIQVPPSPEPPPPTSTTMRPEDLLRQPEPPISSRPSRPSLHRNPSSFTSSKERRLSSTADPLDRTQRRAPRLSRGGERKPPSTGELQAALDPPQYVGAAMSAPIKGKSRIRGMSSASASVLEANRRTSGASSFMRQDMNDPLGKMALHVAAERDLRETTMMMGLDREDEGVRSDLVLDRVWVWKPPR